MKNMWINESLDQSFLLDIALNTVPEASMSDLVSLILTQPQKLDYGSLLRVAASQQPSLPLCKEPLPPGTEEAFSTLLTAGFISKPLNPQIQESVRNLSSSISQMNSTRTSSISPASEVTLTKLG
ncbi:hypothetical protein D3C76_942830 [compost metagenome]